MVREQDRRRDLPLRTIGRQPHWRLQKIRMCPRPVGIDHRSLYTALLCDMLPLRNAQPWLGSDRASHWRNVRLSSRFRRSRLAYITALITLMAAAGCGGPAELPPDQVIQK